ncbi:hypothetical protein V5O48_003035 [Marasmius crinis-equi]|uniref:Phosphoglycerate mutase-like protein n=1 Tax=Marasmius crinis-equi TaxID=585013 RepID=A0ABR3FTX3_9AGAR
MSDSKVLGVLVIARHGDRAGFYQNPNDYTPTATKITPLGNVSFVVDGNRKTIAEGPCFTETRVHVGTVAPGAVPQVNVPQLHLDVRADAGGEGGVIYNSAVSLVQGLFPANSNYTTTLANGTTVEGPLEGYQYVAIESVEPDNDVSLEGWTKCGAFDNSTAEFYSSDEFKKKAEESKPFLDQLPRFLDGRPVTLENMWNIFDFMLVENIHNAEFSKNLPATFLEQARHLTNYHEYGVFSDPQLDGIGNIAFRTMIPTFTKNLKSIANASDPLKFVYYATAYKPFLSLFNMTGVAQAHPELAGFVDFAGSVALEVRQPSGGGAPVVRFNLKNGTDNDYKNFSFMGSSEDVPLQQLLDHLQPAAVNSTADWCKACGNTKDRGCGALAAAESQGRLSAAGSSHQTISPVGAGFLGAGLTIFVALVLLGILFFLGLVAFGKKAKSSKSSMSSHEKA